MNKRSITAQIAVLVLVIAVLLPMRRSFAADLSAEAVAHESQPLSQSASLSGEAAVEWLKEMNALETVNETVSLISEAQNTYHQIAYLKSSNNQSPDYFGISVAISGNTIVVGAKGEFSAATGVNGDQTDNSAFYSGAAYVFIFDGVKWSQQAYLKASNTDTGDEFGTSVAISGDTIVVGSPREASTADGVNGDQSDNSAYATGAAYVFMRNGTTWFQQAYLKASNSNKDDFFGQVVAISGDTIVVGAATEASASRGINGNQLDNSAYAAGAAYVFVRNGTTWSQQAYLKASNAEADDRFGFSVSVSGDTILVGAPFEDSRALGVNGNQNDNSLGSSGAAYVFIRNGSSWSQQAYLKPAQTRPGELFGWFSSLSSDYVVVNQTIYGRTAGVWSLIDSSQYLNSSSMSGDKLVIGAYLDDNRSGSASIASRIGNSWLYSGNVKASNAEANDSFGTSVGVDGNFVVVGAPYEQGSSQGINGAQEGNGSPQSGAVYIFSNLPKPTPFCAGLHQEAESGLLAGPFVVGTDVLASGGTYIHAPNGTGDYFKGPITVYKAEYCFNVPTSGTYRIKSKVYGTEGSSSFYVAVDGVPATGYLWDAFVNTTYTTDYVNNRGIADPVEIPLNAGQHIVDIYIRTDGARLDTIELEKVSDTPPPPPTCGGLVQEAEHGTLSGNFVSASDAAASNGQFIHAPNGSGDFWNGPNTQHKATFCFNVDAAGIYRIKGKVYGADSLSDSFYLQVDDAPTNGYLWDVLPNTTYTSDFVGDRGIADPVEVLLSSGQHTVTVYAREDGTRLDTIELQKAATDINPTPACADLTQEAENGALFGDFATGIDVAASGSQYIHLPSGSGDYWNGPNSRQKAEYCFNVDITGSYRIDGNVLGADALSDSFYVQVDGAPASGYLWDVKSGTSYTLDSVSDRNKADPVIVTLASGQHTVTVYAREDGTRLDTISLNSVVPTAQGRAIPPVAQGVQGTVRFDGAGLTQEIDFSQIKVTLVDIETNGQSFRQQVTADRFGQFRFDGMTPGEYKVQLALPKSLTTTTSEMTVTATADELISLSFDVSAQPEQLDSSKKTYLPLLNR